MMTKFLGNEQLVNNVPSIRRIAKVEGNRKRIGYEILVSAYSPYVKDFQRYGEVYYILMDNDKYPVFIPRELAEEFIENEESAQKFLFNERMQRIR